MLVSQFGTRKVRRIRGQDLAMLRSYLLRLDRDSRRARFGYAVSNAFLCTYSEACIARRAILYGYFEKDVLHGVGELHFDSDSSALPQEGELAFSIERHWRGRGIGAVLMQRLLLAARHRGVAQLSLTCSPDNHAMLGLARKFVSDLTYTKYDVRCYLPAATPGAFSRLREASDAGFAFMTAGIGCHLRNLGQRLRRSPLIRVAVHHNP